MKRKVLNFIIGVSLSLACVVSTSAFNVKAIDSVQSRVTESIEEVQARVTESTEEASSETFEEFLDKMSKLDINSAEDYFRPYYQPLYQKISDIYKSKGKSYSEDELKLRTNIYFSFMADLYEDEENLIKGFKYLELTIDELIDVLNSLGLDLSAGDIEFFRFIFTSALTDPSKLTGEDADTYTELEKEFTDLFKDYTADEMRETINLFWATSQINLSKCTLEERVELLKDIEIDFETFQDIKALTVWGTSDEIISELYDVVLLRNADEEGKTFWINLLQEFISNGENFRDSVFEIVDRMRESNEYKELIGKDLFK